MTGINTYNFTDAETGTTIDASYVTDGTAKVWSNLNGTGTIAERDSLNVSSYVDNGTGDYTTNLTSTMANANFSAVNTGGDGSNGIRAAGAQTYATGSFRTYVRDTANANQDAAYYNLAIFGDLA